MTRIPIGIFLFVTVALWQVTGMLWRWGRGRNGQALFQVIVIVIRVALVIFWIVLLVTILPGYFN